MTTSTPAVERDEAVRVRGLAVDGLSGRAIARQLGISRHRVAALLAATPATEPAGPSTPPATPTTVAAPAARPGGGGGRRRGAPASPAPPRAPGG
ncbi:hypothetical protein ACFV0R_15680, partial [Streptomyces sp. NPDC059578]